MTSRSDEGVVIAVRAPATRIPERRYILDQILGEWLGIRYVLQPSDQGHVSLGRLDQPDAGAISMPDTLLSTPEADWLSERSLPLRPLGWVTIPCAAPATSGDRPAARPIPVLYRAPGSQGLAWTVEPSGLSLNLDLLGSAFALLTRLEELVPVPRDAHDRFPARASTAVSEGFLDRPLVDEYVDLLWLAMRTQWPDLERRHRVFELTLTHDVDTPWAALGRPPRAAVTSAAGDLMKRRDPVLAAQRLRALADARRGSVVRDPVNSFDFIMTTSERHGLRSTFYFQAGTIPGDPDFRYRLSDAPFRPLLRRIHDRGHEIGLHGSYASYASSDRIRMEADALRETCWAAGIEQPGWGGRQHYLRFRNPDTWRAHEAAGLAHDSTLGFPELPGFRSGTCREHTVFDLVGSRTLAVRERPLIAMDATMFGYMGLGFEDAARQVRTLVSTCRRHAGNAVLLYHNDTLAGARARAHYSELVQELVRPD